MFPRGMHLWTVVLALATCFCRVLSDASKKAHIPGAYIVSLHPGLTAEDFFRELKDAGYHGKLGLEFSSDVLNGLSFTLENGQTRELDLAGIKTLPSVLRAWSDRVVEARRSHGPTADQTPIAAFRSRKRSTALLPQLVMAQVDKLQAEGITGQGVHVAVLDGGLDYTHPEFGIGSSKGCFGKGCLVTTGYDFVGDVYDPNHPMPDGDPFGTCTDHSTIDTGLIAAQGHNDFGFIGVSPGVTLGIYRIFACKGTASDSIIIAAITRAYQDGADVIAASFGDNDGWGDSPIAALVEGITAKGTIVAASAGNAFRRGFYQTVAPGSAPGASVAGSAHNIKTTGFLFKGSFALGNETQSDQHQFGFTRADKNDWPSGPTQLLVLGAFDDPNTQACDPIATGSLGDLSNLIVLVGFFQKKLTKCYAPIQVKNLINAGAKYIIFYGEDDGWDFNFGLLASVSLPAAAYVNRQQGKQWIDLIKAGQQVKVRIPPPNSDGFVAFADSSIGPGVSASYFSSFGPLYRLNQYITVLAPGGDVLSTTLQRLGSYVVESGTSQSAAYLAGVYALLKSGLKKSGRAVSPQILENLVSITAKPNLYIDPWTFETHPFLAPVTQQGAGNVQAYDALHTTTYIDASKIEFNDTVHNGPRSFKVFNNGKQAVTYRLSNVPSATFYFLDGTGPYSKVKGSPHFDLAHAELSFDQSQVTIQPGQSATITVSAKPPKLRDDLIPLYSGYIAINGSDSKSWSIPYSGAACDYGANVPVLIKEDTYLYDWTQRGPDEGYTSNPPRSLPNTTFVVPYPPDSNATTANPLYHFPAINTRVPFFSSLLRIDVEPLDLHLLPSNWTTHKQIGITVLGPGLVPQEPFFQPTDTQLSSPYWWDGTLADFTFAPAGRYRLWVSVLKLFGDENKADGYVQIPSVPFYLKYNDTTKFKTAK